MATNDNLQDYLTALASSFRYATNSTEPINAQTMITLPAQLGEGYNNYKACIQGYYANDVDIELPLGITKVRGYALSNDTMYISKLTIPEGVTKIDSYAFDKVNVKEVYVPSTITSFSASGNYNAPNSNYKCIVHYNSSIEDLLNLGTYVNLFSKNTTYSLLKTFNIEGNLYVKNGNNEEIVKNVVVPKEIQTLSMRGVYHKDGVLTFEENSQLTYLNFLPFFKKIYLPKGPYSMLSVFEVGAIEELHYDGTMVDYLNLTFGNSNNCSFFGSGAKVYFKNVLQDKILIPEGVVSIPSTAFYKFENTVNEVVIASTVVSIESNAFSQSNSSKQTVVRLLGTTPPTLANSYVFGSVPKFIVPASALNTYKTTTNWSSYASKIFPDSNIEISIDSTLLNNSNILYSVDGGEKQQFTNGSLSLQGVGTLTIYNTSSETIKLGKTSGGSEVGTSGPNTTITYTFTDVSTLYITKA